MEYLPPKMLDLIEYTGKAPEKVQTALSFDQILIKSVYHNMYDVVVDMVKSSRFNNRLLEDIGICEMPFPIYYITLCYKRVMWQDFIEETMPMVLEQRKRIDDLLLFWEENCGVDIHQKIDYKKYSELFYCADETDSIEDVFFDDIQKYLDNGCRMIDLELFEAVEKFQFERVKDLLEKGANPEAKLISIDEKDKNDYYNCFDRIGMECSYLCSCEVFPMLKKKLGAWYINYAITDKDLGDLLGWAAHEDMYKLLNELHK